MPGPDDAMHDEFEDDEAMDDSCPECGAGAGEPCDPMCPNAEEEEGVDPDSEYDGRVDREPVMPESKFTFDKFMDRILVETKKRGINVVQDNPRRSVAARYQERPLGKTRVGGK